MTIHLIFIHAFQVRLLDGEYIKSDFNIDDIQQIPKMLKEYTIPLDRPNCHYYISKYLQNKEVYMAVLNQELANKRLGEQAQMKNGQQATIIAYRGATDMDILFEDGTIVEHKSYSEWKRRQIRNPNYTPPNPDAQSRIGETRTMYNGQKATIIAYRNSVDIDVQFEDGIVREHVRYPHFLTGKIKPISPADLAKQRLGETRYMNCGLQCTIIEYVSSHNITVKFENDVIVKDKYYKDFMEGTIFCPGAQPNQKDIVINNDVCPEDFIGESRVMENGMRASIVAYRQTNDIDVQFEDGDLRTGVSYTAFRQCAVKHTSELLSTKMQSRVGETRKMKNGHTASIIKYHSHEKVDIQFDDGAVVENQRYEKFTKGDIPHPQIKYKTSMSLQEFAIGYYLQHLGFCKIQQGEWKDKGFGRLELDFYHETANIAIEYDGSIHNKPGTAEREVRKNKCCTNNGIILYRLRDPYCKELKDTSSINYILSQKNKITSGLFDCKKELELILQKHSIPFDSADIDFERDKDDILQQYNDTYINYYANKRVGYTIYSPSAKQNITVIAYHDSGNVDVRFEDGLVRRHLRWSEVKKGSVAHPNDTPEGQALQRTGETRLMKNNFLATIVAYRSATDIDVQFEDGNVREHIDYADFKIGHVKHPLGYSRKTQNNYKKVRNITTNIIYDSASDAAKAYGCCSSAIQRCCNGLVKTSCKCRWEYYIDKIT